MTLINLSQSQHSEHTLGKVVVVMCKEVGSSQGLNRAGELELGVIILPHPCGGQGTVSDIQKTSSNLEDEPALSPGVLSSGFRVMGMLPDHPLGMTPRPSKTVWV